MQDFVTWLAIQYNLEVRVIQSNNTIKLIKTKEWSNNMIICFNHLLQSFIHKPEKFKQLIIEKDRAMRLSANISYQL